MNPKIPRRRVLQTFAAAALAPALPDVARAQAWPSRPVKIIVGFSPGSSPDLWARMLATHFAEKFRQQFVVENRTGAGGTIAVEAVARAPADGHTLLSSGSVDTITATLHEKLNYDYLRDIAPIGGLTFGANVLVAHPSAPFNTIPEFIAWARANPGKLTMASGGVGAGGHLAGVLFQQRTGLSFAHVPYRGDPPAQTDVVAGHIPFMFAVVTPALELIRSGKLKAIAVTTPRRSPALPDVPTIGDTLEGYQVAIWAGLATTQGAPMEVIEKLNIALNELMASPAIVARNRDFGVTTFPDNTPHNFSRFVAEEVARWAKVIKAGNIKPE